jgi:hypothetical protein
MRERGGRDGDAGEIHAGGVGDGGSRGDAAERGERGDEAFGDAVGAFAHIAGGELGGGGADDG